MLLSASDNNKIECNFIGTSTDGTTALPNEGSGIRLIRVGVDGSDNNTIGGAFKRNLVSGNDAKGIKIEKSCSGNLVQGNFVGTDVTGMATLGNANDGIQIENGAFNNTVGGTTAGTRNIISGNGSDGVELDGSVFGCIVLGNYIGTDSTGTVDLGNTFNGIVLSDSAYSNTIGGTAAGAGNLISGNGELGVILQGVGTRNNKVQGNIIGLNAAGTSAIPNDDSGVKIENSNSNLIGGTSAGARNVISGNGDDVSDHGISITEADSNTVRGNYIGTNAGGTAAIANFESGIQIFSSNHSNIWFNLISGNTSTGISIGEADSSVVQGNFVGTDLTGTQALPNSIGIDLRAAANFNLIGGTNPQDRNLISGNTRLGIGVFRGSSSNTIQGNRIGTNLAGTGDLGNGEHGINFIKGAINNLIGGIESGAANIIAFNDSSGISMRDNAGTSNAIWANSIFNNGLLGIDLDGDSVTLNDAGDSDTGANNLQNFPVLNSVTSGSINITGSLNSSANSNFRIEFFSNTVCNGDQSGTGAATEALKFGEGETFLGADTVTTDVTGNVNFVSILGGTIASGTHVTATATSLADSSTSEFSACIQVVNPVVADAGDDRSICLGQSTQLGGDPTGSGGLGGPYTFAWTPTTGLDDATKANPTASPGSTTTYSVKVTDNNSQTATDEVVVTVNPNPVADAGPDQGIASGGSVQIGGSPTASGGTGGFTFVWSPATGLDATTSANPTANPAATTEYIVVVTDGNGCTDSDTLTVTVTGPQCTISALAAGTQTACDPATNQYTQQVTVTYENEPSSGTLDVNGQSFAITASPQTVTLTGLVSDGQLVNVTATFSDNQACTLTETGLFTAPNSCTQIGGIPHNFLLLADKSIEFMGHKSSTGNIHSNEDITFTKGSPSTHTGNVTAGDDVNIQKRNTIEGDVKAGDNINVSGSATVTGSVEENAQVANVAIPAIPNFSNGNQDIEVPKNGSLALAPGDYESVKARKEATLQLSSGTYNLFTLRLKKKAVLEVNITGGPIIINLTSKLDVDNDVEMQLIGGTAADVLFNVAGTVVKIRDNTKWFGTIIAPQATVELRDEVSFTGQVCARRIEIGADAVLQQATGPTGPQCTISALAAGTQTACDPANNSYTQEVTVTFANPPASGTLDVNGQSFAIDSSPRTVTLTGLVSDGKKVDVTATFSENKACTLTKKDLFTAPASCAPVCAITALTAGTQTACDPANNSYTQEVTVTFANPPASGTLDVNGQSFQIGSSPQTVVLTGLIADSNLVDVTATFSKDDECALTEKALFRAPASCAKLLHPFLLLAQNKIEFNRHKRSSGDIHSNGRIDFKKGRPSTHDGDVTAVDKIDIRKRNTIIGNVTSDNTVKVDKNATVTGTVEENAKVAEFPLPKLPDFHHGDDNVEVAKNKTLTLSPGDYKTVKVREQATLVLSTGKYNLKSLNMSKKSSLEIKLTGGPVVINVSNDLNINDDVEMKLVGGTSLDVRFNVVGGSVKLRDNDVWFGTILAPDATVTLDKGVYYQGSICAEQIFVRDKVVVLKHSTGSGTTTHLTSLAVKKRELIAKAAADSTGKTAESAKANPQSQTLDGPTLPTEFALKQNYPNPFNPSTTIRFDLPVRARVTLTIYNMLGQKVRTLVSGQIVAGRHQVVWDGNDSHGLRVASGIYVYQFKAKDFVASRKLNLLK